MSRHTITTDAYGTGWRAYCSCRASGPPNASRSLAEDWGPEHLRTVERAKAHLNGTPTLATTYAYYRRMENDQEVPAKEREQWKVLADGLEHRLGLVDHTDSMYKETLS